MQVVSSAIGSPVRCQAFARQPRQMREYSHASGAQTPLDSCWSSL